MIGARGMFGEKIKPITKTVKIYPEIELEPLQSLGWDKLTLRFESKGIMITPVIDGAGNEFYLDYKELKRYLL